MRHKVYRGQIDELLSDLFEVVDASYFQGSRHFCLAGWLDVTAVGCVQNCRYHGNSGSLVYFWKGPFRIGEMCELLGG